MVRNKKVSGTAKSVPVGICIGTAAALAVTLVGTLIAAWLISYEKIDENASGYCAMIILLTASAIGAYTVQAVVKHNKPVMCVAAGITYYLMLLAITALFFGGQYQAMGVTALVIAAGSSVVILVGLKENNMHKRKHKKYGYG